ncbi:hypothetical protein Cni_G06117 [Canna indica]|uniref:Uncharacterized protein n=1 Tax=Canna indica TaxID=4628 RepID=A0AAQ3JY18_9LILI|nr:hypothetical protein Cni_G06117 [Canna indica]
MDNSVSCDVWHMASTIFSHLQNIWPFSAFKIDDLKISTQLVRKLSLPDKTKQFVFAVREPDSNAVVYILAAQNLSLQSAIDAENLIKEVRPKAVIAQISSSALTEETCLRNDQVNHVPTSSFGVLKRCFMEKMNKDIYERFAGCQVLEQIFGVGFYGHFLSAKRAAEEIGSHFMLLESPYEKGYTATSVDNDKDGGQSAELHIQASGLLPGKFTLATANSLERYFIEETFQLQMIKSVIPLLDLVISKEGQSSYNDEKEPGKDQPNFDYKVPPFAQSFYPLLADLHDIFTELPSIGKAMVSLQKMLADINEGQPVNTQTLSSVYIFRIAVEGLRIALNNVAHFPIERAEKSNSTKLEYFDLPLEEKGYVLFGQALRNQAKKHGSVVAIVDASCLAGLRRHWNTSIPLKVAESADTSFTDYYDENLGANDEKVKEHMKKKSFLADKPVVAVGAGATAVVGASSLSKVIPASTFIKLSTYKIPATLKFGLAHFQRAASIGLSKILAASNPLAHGITSAGAKTSTLKFTASAEKIRAMTHTMIASAERTSLLAMRTSFYEIMRTRGVRPIRIASLATFGCSMVACSGLLAYGDGIECAVESLPFVPTIATLGRGLEGLHQASKEVEQTNGTKIQEALQSLMYNLRKMRAQ